MKLEADVKLKSDILKFMFILITTSLYILVYIEPIQNIEAEGLVYMLLIIASFMFGKYVGVGLTILKDILVVVSFGFYGGVDKGEIIAIIIADIIIVGITLWLKKSIDDNNVSLKRRKFENIIKVIPVDFGISDRGKLTLFNERMGEGINIKEINEDDEACFNQVVCDKYAIGDFRLPNEYSEKIETGIYDSVNSLLGKRTQIEIVDSRIDNNKQFLIIRDEEYYDYNCWNMDEANHINYKKILDTLSLSLVIHGNNKIECKSKRAIEVLDELGEDEDLDFDEIFKAHELNILNNYKSSFEEQIYSTKLKSDIRIYTTLVYPRMNIFYSFVEDYNSSAKMERYKNLIEMVREKEREKREFFGNISHELKTPINVIYSSIQVLSKLIETKTDEDTNGYIQNSIKIIKGNCFRQMKLINDTIDLSKIAEGYNVVNKGWFNIVDVIEETLDNCISHIDYSKVKIIFDTNQEEKNIYISGKTLERIIINLILIIYRYSSLYDQIYVKFKDMCNISIIEFKIPESTYNSIRGKFVIDANDEYKGIDNLIISLIRKLLNEINAEIVFNGDSYINIIMDTIERPYKVDYSKIESINSERFDMINQYDIEFSMARNRIDT